MLKFAGSPQNISNVVNRRTVPESVPVCCSFAAAGYRKSEKSDTNRTTWTEWTAWRATWTEWRSLAPWTEWRSLAPWSEWRSLAPWTEWRSWGRAWTAWTKWRCRGRAWTEWGSWTASAAWRSAWKSYVTYGAVHELQFSVPWLALARALMPPSASQPKPAAMQHFLMYQSRDHQAMLPLRLKILVMHSQLQVSFFPKASIPPSPFLSTTDPVLAMAKCPPPPPPASLVAHVPFVAPKVAVDATSIGSWLQKL